MSNNKDYDDAIELVDLASKYDLKQLYGQAYHHYIMAIDKYMLASKQANTQKLRDEVKKVIERAELIKPIVAKAANETVNSVKLKVTEIKREIELNNPHKAEIFLHEALNKMESENVGLKCTLSKEKDFLVDQLSILNKKITEEKENPEKKGVSGGSYTQEELVVLKASSFINKIDYMPFLCVDYKEDFSGGGLFWDKNGDLRLSRHQAKLFSGWKRPSQLVSQPKLISSFDYRGIRQSVVSDCSFVSSLIVAAQYQTRFRRPLISSIIFPQSKGSFLYNPRGKFMVTFHINGVWRKVIIDDRLPVMSRDMFLCAYTDGDYWVPLLEKAYMKVMGGYDFPGSNSSIDLHALTGWIPERVNIDHETFRDPQNFRRMVKHHNAGNCLITAASVSLNEKDSFGIVSLHSYSVIRLVETRTLGLMLLRLKNPWAEKCWRGKYSKYDRTRWTRELKHELDYNPDTSQDEKNGEFWIDLQSLKSFFGVLYLNWSPSMFPHSTCLHDLWSMKESPKKDRISIGPNPQYHLSFSTKSRAVVWILLSRHITEIDDFAHNQRFVTIDVYRSARARLIYYTNDPKPYKPGIRINSPHYLCQLHEEAGDHGFNLVVSEFEKSTPIFFTLRVYSSVEFSLRKIDDVYHYKQTVVGEWGPSNAGGSPNYQSYPSNPQYMVSIGKSGDVVIELRAPVSLAVGMQFKYDDRGPSIYRRGYCVEDLVDVPAGSYKLVVSTYHPDHYGTFIINIKSTVPITVE